MKENRIITGDALTELQKLPSRSVNCCVTSPPYYGLRDYGTAAWIGGDADCDHHGKALRTSEHVNEHCGTGTTHHRKECYRLFGAVCEKCGAVRVDKQIGLEKTPEDYINKLVEVFREVRRVLKDDGTLWVNIADSYAGSGKGDALYPAHCEGHYRNYGQPATELSLQQAMREFEKRCAENPVSVNTVLGVNFTTKRRDLEPAGVGAADLLQCVNGRLKLSEDYKLSGVLSQESLISVNTVDLLERERGRLQRASDNATAKCARLISDNISELDSPQKISAFMGEMAEEFGTERCKSLCAYFCL